MIKVRTLIRHWAATEKLASELGMHALGETVMARQYNVSMRPLGETFAERERETFAERQMRALGETFLLHSQFFTGRSTTSGVLAAAAAP